MRRFKYQILVTLLIALSNLANADEQGHGEVTAWGKVVDPDQDCAFLVGDDSLSIRFGAGKQELAAEVNQMTAPRLLRSVEGNFSIQVTVDGNLPLPAPSLEVSLAYISGALVVMQDDRNYIRLERASFTRSGQTWHYANFEQRSNAQRKRMGLFADCPLPPRGPVDLRLEVQENQVRGLVRIGNQDWREVGSAVIESPGKLLAGVSGVKTSAEEATVHFRQLRFAGDDPAIAAFSSNVGPTAEPPELAIKAKTPALTSMKWFQLARDLRRRGFGIRDMSDEEQSKLIADAKDLAMNVSKDASSSLPLSIATDLARGFERAQRPLIATRVYGEFAEALEPILGSGTGQQLREMQKLAEAKANRIGMDVELHGLLINRKSLDWQRYRDKVVLIQFWASWSGPYALELPQLKKLYETYHDQGLEVIGVCVDSEFEQAEAFIEYNEIAWENLFSEKVGFEHPAAKRLGVKSVPSAILVDREGKIVSLSAQGDSLSNLLTEYFNASSRSDHAEDGKDPVPSDAVPLIHESIRSAEDVKDES